MAKMLIESMSSDWDPEKYQDQYQTALKDLIDAKIAKRPLKAKESPRRTAGEVVDLVKILQESLAASGAKKERGKASPGAKRSTATLVKQKRPRGSL
jgi:DNA end-binding protein Ku